MGKYCGNCGAEIEIGQKFCGNCGAKLPEYTKTERVIRNDHIAPVASEKTSRVNVFCVLLIVGCILLWLFAPLAAINYLSLGDQPTGWSLLSGEDYDLEYLADSMIFKLEVFVLVGLVLCLLIEITGKQIAVRVLAALTELGQLIIVISVLNWLDGEMDYFKEAFGYGFWGISVLLLLAVLFASNPKPKNNESVG